MQAVYIDVLILENFVMDYFILYMTSKILYYKKTIRPGKMLLRIGCSSGLGVLYTVVSVLVFRSALSLFLLKATLSIGMFCIAFYPKNLYQLFKSAGCFYGVTLLCGGAAMVVVGETGSGHYILLVVAIVTVIGDSVLKSIKQHRVMEKWSVDLYIQFEDQGIWIPALVDSGNELKDPCSGQSVIVVELDAVSSILPEKIVTLLQNTEGESFFSKEIIACLDEWATKLRLVPFASLGCKCGMLVGFRAAVIRIRTGDGKCMEQQNQTVCLCAQTLSGEGTYKGLLGQETLQDGELIQACSAIPA